MNRAQAIESLTPGAQFTLQGDTVVDWRGPGIQPSEADILAKMAEPAPVRVLDPSDFRRRFTVTERREATARAETNDGVYEALDLLAHAKVVELDNPLTNTMLDALVAAGVLTEARKAEVLA